MDVVQSVQGYITKIVSQGENVSSGSASAGAAKMKILLLDQDTVCKLVEMAVFTSSSQ
jgi:hypothetical protein